MNILSYQGTPRSGDIASNLAVIEQTASGARQLNADVIVFPELFITGYNINKHISALAQPIDGDIVTQLKSIAQLHKVAIIVGFPEREKQHVYNSAVAINKAGVLVGHHRKVFLFGDIEKSLFTPGQQFSVFTLDGYNCAITICYDIEFPESVRYLARKNAQIIFNPTANMTPFSEVPKTLARARALENGVVVVYANLCGAEHDLEYTGLSAIISPNGIDLARAGNSSATLLADVSEVLASNIVSPTSTQLIDLKQTVWLTSAN